MVAVVKRLHDHTIGRVCCIGNGLRLSGVGGERLFTQHVFARGNRLQGPLGVQAVRQRVVDRVDVRIVDDVVVRRVHARDAVLGGVCVGTGSVAGGDRGDGGTGYALRRLDDGQRRDPRRADDADPQVGH